MTRLPSSTISRKRPLCYDTRQATYSYLNPSFRAVRKQVKHIFSGRFVTHVTVTHGLEVRSSTTFRHSNTSGGSSPRLTYKRAPFGGQSYHKATDPARACTRPSEPGASASQHLRHALYIDEALVQAVFQTVFSSKKRKISFLSVCSSLVLANLTKMPRSLL